MRKSVARRRLRRHHHRWSILIWHEILRSARTLHWLSTFFSFFLWIIRERILCVVESLRATVAMTLCILLLMLSSYWIHSSLRVSSYFILRLWFVVVVFDAFQSVFHLFFYFYCRSKINVLAHFSSHQRDISGTTRHTLFSLCTDNWPLPWLFFLKFECRISFKSYKLYLRKKLFTV